MEQKHSMMYPSLTRRPDAPSTSQENDVPLEAPPSYDMAMAGATVPEPSAPLPTTRMSFQPPSAASPPMVHATLDNYSSNVIPMSSRLPPVIVEQPGSEPLKLGPKPSAVTCPDCGERRKSRMHYTPNKRTHIFAMILCLVGWCCCACCVPYCMNSCKTGHHYCAKCNRFLGTYNRNAF